MTARLREEEEREREEGESGVEGLSVLVCRVWEGRWSVEDVRSHQ